MIQMSRVLLLESNCSVHLYFSLWLQDKYFLFMLLQAVVTFVTMQFQLCTVFFTFSLGTRTHYFGRTILHGGAKVLYLNILQLLVLTLINKCSYIYLFLVLSVVSCNW